MSNLLQKYYRQPKIYLALPSKGQWNHPGVVDGDPNNLPVFGMTAMDEVMFKTPDALFSGEATVEVMKSCIPGLKQPWLLPQLDIDSILVAIRIATYGQTLETNFKCTSCNEENKFDLDLSKTLDYFQSITWETSVIVGPLNVNLRPLTYKESTDIAVASFELRKRIWQASDADSEEEKNKIIDECMKRIAELQVEGFTKAIANIEVEDGIVNDPAEISEWIKNSDKEFFDGIKNHLDKQQEKWQIQTQKVNCVGCNHENTVKIGLDNSDFFVNR